MSKNNSLLLYARLALGGLVILGAVILFLGEPILKFISTSVSGFKKIEDASLDNESGNPPDEQRKGDDLNASGGRTVGETGRDGLQSVKKNVVEETKNTIDRVTNRAADLDPTGTIKKQPSSELLESFKKLPATTDTERVVIAKRLLELPLSDYNARKFDPVVSVAIEKLKDSNSNRVILLALANADLPSAALHIAKLTSTKEMLEKYDGEDTSIEIGKFLEIAADSGSVEAITLYSSWSIKQSLRKNGEKVSMGKLISRLESISDAPKPSGSCYLFRDIGSIINVEEELDYPCLYLALAHHLQSIKFQVNSINRFDAKSAESPDLINRHLPKIDEAFHEIKENAAENLNDALETKKKINFHTQESIRYYQKYLTKSLSKGKKDLANCSLMVLFSDRKSHSIVVVENYENEARRIFVNQCDSIGKSGNSADPFEMMCMFWIHVYSACNGKDAKSVVEGDASYYADMYVGAVSRHKDKIKKEAEELESKRLEAAKLKADEEMRLKLRAEAEAKRIKLLEEEKLRRAQMPPAQKISEFMTGYLALLSADEGKVTTLRSVFTMSNSTSVEDFAKYIHNDGATNLDGKVLNPEQFKKDHEDYVAKTYNWLSMKELTKGNLDTSRPIWIYRTALANTGVKFESNEIADSISFREYSFIDTEEGIKLMRESIIAYSLLGRQQMSVKKPIEGVISTRGFDYAALRSEPSDVGDLNIIKKMQNGELVRFWPVKVFPSGNYKTPINWNFAITADGKCGMVSERLITVKSVLKAQPVEFEE